MFFTPELDWLLEKQLDDDLTLLFDDLPSPMLNNDKERTTLSAYEEVNFYGWEAERVVVVTTGRNFFIVELAMKAKTKLILSRTRRKIG